MGPITIIAKTSFSSTTMMISQQLSNFEEACVFIMHFFKDHGEFTMELEMYKRAMYGIPQMTGH
jgi:hypothetical protein